MLSLVSNLRWFTPSILLMLTIIPLSGYTQTYSSDTCIAHSKSNMLRMGIDKLYTGASGPIRSISVKNKQWSFDSNGRITQVLEVDINNTETINKTKIIAYYRSGQIKSVSRYEKSDPAEEMPSALAVQELYFWKADTLHLVQLKGQDTLRSVTEVIDQAGCVTFLRETKGRYRAEYRYKYNSGGMQAEKSYKYWNKGILQEGSETRSSYKSGVLSSKVTTNLITGKANNLKYQLIDGELRGFTDHSSGAVDENHVISYDVHGDIIFRKYDQMEFRVVKKEIAGTKTEEKIFVYKNGRKKTDKYEFSANGDVTIINLENGKETRRTIKTQVFDDYGNWVELKTRRIYLGKPVVKKSIIRKIEYYK